jgi:hypothetical protein
MSKPKESHKARQTADATHLAPDAKSLCVRIPGGLQGEALPQRYRDRHRRGNKQPEPLG